MDIASIVGLIIGVGGITVGNLLEGGHMGALLQSTAAMIVFGGTFGAVLVSHNFSDIRRAFSDLKWVFRSVNSATRTHISNEVISLAKLARKESLLSVEKRIANIGDPFMKSVFRFMVDGVDPDVLRRMFEAESEQYRMREMVSARVWADAGGFAPTIGIIGAVLGLIHVMANVTDTSALGHGIAVAFVATIYGVGSANLVFIPFANKLRRRVEFDMQTRAMILEGAIAIVSGLNPYIVEQKVRAYEGISA